MRIWKYGLAITDRQTVEMPAGAKPLSVAMQGDDLVMWALVHPGAVPERVTIRIFGTGHPADDAKSLWFLGTVLMQEGALVWHVFYYVNREPS